MRRFVYSPRVDAWVKTDWGIIDLSPFIVSGSVTRRVNQVSSASLVLRNPDFRWTNRRVRLRPDPITGERVEEVFPVFHPMDPITITLTRLKDLPVQVFTGYLDKTPYTSLYPGTVKLEASCTMKRLLHTYWDPAVQGSLQLLAENGWIISRDGQFLGPQNQTSQDASFGRLLEQILIRVGHWHSANIHIGAIPPNLPSAVAALAKETQEDAEAAKKELDKLLAGIIGITSYGSGSVTTDPSKGAPGPGGGTISSRLTSGQAAYAKELARLTGLNQCVASAWVLSEGLPSSGANNFLNISPTQHINYPTAEAGAKAAADNLSATKGVGYEQVLAAAKSGDPQAQINAIVASSWDAGHYGGGAGFKQLYDQCAHQAAVTGNPTNDPLTGSGPRAAMRGSVARAAGANPISNSTPGRALPLPADVINNASHSIDHGVDFEPPAPVPIYAIGDGVITNSSQAGYGFGPNYPVLKLDHPINGEVYVYYGHSISSVANNTHVSAGDQIGMTAGAGCQPPYGNCPKGHVEIGFSPPGAPGATYPGVRDNSPAGQKMLGTIQAIAKGSPLPQKGNSGGNSAGGSSGTGGGGGTGDTGFDSQGNGGGIWGTKDPIPWYKVRQDAKATAFAAILEAPSLAEIQEAALLTGKKSLMNDKPLLPFIEQLCTASLRSFMSLPNGDFFAWYPDYFGGLGRQPYWEIDDIEILDGKIELSDDALATHVYVVGDTSAPFTGFGGQGVDMWDRVQSLGVVTIQDAFRTKFLNFDPMPDDTVSERDLSKVHDRLLDLSQTDDANAFLQKYGARPKLLEMPMIRNPWYELFMAYQTFCLMWSQQFLTDFTFTFMPELFPGGLVSFPDHGIQCYVNEVTHTFDYESGFNTQATLMAPSALAGSGSRGVNVGMVRSGVLANSTSPAGLQNGLDGLGLRKPFGGF